MKVTVRGKTIEFELGGKDDKFIPLEFGSPLAAAQCFLLLTEAPSMNKDELMASMGWGDLHEHFKNLNPKAPKELVEAVLAMPSGEHTFSFPALGPLDEDPKIVSTVCRLRSNDALRAALTAIPQLADIAPDLPQAIEEVGSNPNGELARALSRKDTDRAMELLENLPQIGL